MPGPKSLPGGPSTPTLDAHGGRSNLALRVISALIMAPAALVVAYVDGWWFIAFWSVAALAILWEWTHLSVGRALSVQIAWGLAGLVYAGAMLAATVILRGDGAFGFAAIVFLFAIVWGTDIFAYFVGRALGGPKLAPAISPKKTWSGALGGTLFGIAAAIAVAVWANLTNLFAVAVLALVLSIVSQGGDLLESAIKRRFDTKDASQLIPGHGGVMDRLDGYVTAVVLACVIGLVRGGFAMPARGLLVW